MKSMVDASRRVAPVASDIPPASGRRVELIGVRVKLEELCAPCDVDQGWNPT